MDRCKEIVANVKMEECYEGMSLVFDAKREDLRAEIDARLKRHVAKQGSNRLYLTMPIRTSHTVKHFISNLPMKPKERAVLSLSWYSKSLA